MTEDIGEWFTDPEHLWQLSDLVKCVVSTAAPKYKYMQSQILKMKLKSEHAFQSFYAPHINSGSLMPAFYLHYNYPIV